MKIERSAAGRDRDWTKGRAAVPAPEAPLPLVHITLTGRARTIVKNQQIRSRKCDVFEEDLVYFFAYRPAYKVEDAGDKSDLLNNFPFVFVLDSTDLGNPHHVYPFDTGAAASGRYGDRPDKSLKLEDYEREPEISAAVAHINWAFGSAKLYYEGTIKPDLQASLVDWDEVELAFLSISRQATAGTNHKDYDRRASAVEIAYKGNVELKGTVKFVIVPKNLIYSQGQENRRIIEELNAIGAKIKTYDWMPNKRPIDYHEEISTIVKSELGLS